MIDGPTYSDVFDPEMPDSQLNAALLARYHNFARGTYLGQQYPLRNDELRHVVIVANATVDAEAPRRQTSRHRRTRSTGKIA